MAQDSFKLSLQRKAIQSTVESTGELQTSYSVEATCSVVKSVDPQALRLDQNVFVKNVESNAFVRVASASDLGLLYSDQARSSSSGHTEYRDSVASFSFEDIDTAVAAIPVIKDRVNTLLYNYVKYATEFLDESRYKIEYNLPTGTIDSNQANEYVASYAAARDARAESDAEITESQASLDALSYKQDVLSEMQGKFCDFHDQFAAHQAALVDLHAKTQLNDQNSAALTLGNFMLAQTHETITAEVFTKARDCLLSIGAVFTDTSTLKSSFGLTLAGMELECTTLGAKVTAQNLTQDGLVETLSELKEENRAAVAVENAATAKLAELCPDINPVNIP